MQLSSKCFKLDSSAKKSLASKLATPTGRRPTRKSVRRSSVESSTSPLLKDNLVQVTPELTVRKRAWSRSTESDRQAKVSKMDDLKAQLGLVLGSLTEIKGKMVVKDDLKGIKQRLSGLEDSQKEMTGRQKGIEDRLTSLERGERKKADPNNGQETSSPKFTEDFIKARRSLLLSPVQPYIPNLKDYLLNYMKVPEDIVADIQMSDIRRVHPRKMPPHRKKQDDTKKVHVSFRDSHERDVIVSYASNLPENCKLDIVIPDHLMTTKSKLDRLAFKIRKHAADNDKRVSTSLRLDDSTESLVTAVRDGKDSQWLYYSVMELEELESSLCKTGPGEDYEEN